MIRRIALAMIVAMLSTGNALVQPAAVAAGPPAIAVFQSASAFSGYVRIQQKITFDDLPTGASLGNPAALGPLRFLHASAAAWKTESAAYLPVSSPNVLAPFRSDGTLAGGVTTLAFDVTRTKAVGLYLIVPRGLGASAFLTTTATATNVKGQRADVTITFQGSVGEQQFVGFASHSPLATVSFDVASAAGWTSTLALDDIYVGK